MSPGLVLSLVALALVDSTSIGTLVIPVWLLLASRRGPGLRPFAYLGAIAGFYLVVGVVLVLLARAGLDQLPGLADSPVVLWARLGLGVALFALCWRYDSGRRRRQGKPDRSVRWRNRVLSEDVSPKALVGLALTAGGFELLTMLPYLAAIGLLVTASLPAVAYLPVLAGYCLVMTLPAAALVALRLGLGRRLDPPLQRIDAFASRHADSAIGWVMGVAGVLLAGDAALRLWWPHLL